MPSSRMRPLVVLGVVLAVASVAVPTAWGIHLHLSGLAQAVAGSALLVGCSALALNGSRPVPLPARQSVPAVLATTAANAVTPAGIGGTVLVLRFHRRSGLSAEQAAAAAGLRTAFGAVTATLVTAVVASTVGMQRLPAGRTGLWVALGVAVALAVVVAALPAARRKVLAGAARLAAAV
ncbi:MAG: lysylphosphatidylglycerol synthase domain-containing protein, partial [Mycobacteriales bacterium]